MVGSEEVYGDDDDFEEDENDSKKIDEPENIDHVPSSELQNKLYETTKSLVSEGEKNLRLVLEVSKQRDELTLLRQEAEAFRATLLQGINGGVTNSNNYEHVSLEDLLRIRLQQATASEADDDIAATPSLKDKTSIEVVKKLEDKLKFTVQHNDELEGRCIQLKDKLAAATKRNEGIENLHIKVSKMTDRIRYVLEQKARLNKHLVEETKKVEVLSDHVEKLMIHLKHEAIAKASSLSDQSRLQCELDHLKTRLEHMLKKSDRKDKLVVELRESGKMLDDQLRLMDEKYMDIRSKLVWTRSHTTKILRQKELEMQHLREKISVLVTKCDNKNHVSIN